VHAKNRECWYCVVVFTELYVQDGSFLVSFVVMLCEQFVMLFTKYFELLVLGLLLLHLSGIFFLNGGYVKFYIKLFVVLLQGSLFTSSVKLLEKLFVHKTT